MIDFNTMLVKVIGRWNLNAQNYRMHDMVQDAYGMHSSFEFGDHVEEAPND